MSATLKFLLFVVVFALVSELFEAKDLKELAKALRQKREDEMKLQQVEELAQKAGEDAALVRRKRSCGCCCCCCCCGCGRKKRNIFQVLRAKRNSLSNDVISEPANDYGYGGQTDYGLGEFSTGRGGESQRNQQKNNNRQEEEDCAECDE